MNDRKSGREALDDLQLILGEGETLAHADLLSHRGFFAELDGRADEAFAFLERSACTYKLNNDLQGAAAVDVLIGNLMISQSRYAEARHRFVLSLSVLEPSTVRLKPRIDAELGLAFCEMEDGMTSTAITRLKCVIAGAEEIHYRAGLARGHFYLALAADRLGNSAVALKEAELALEHARTTDLRVLVGAEVLRYNIQKTKG